MTNPVRLILLYLLLYSGLTQAAIFPADSTRPDRPVSSTATTAELNVRVNYTSRAVFSGRDFGVREWLSTPSITYYAKSGFYADISGYYLSQSQPPYQLTALSVGYLSILSSYFAVSGELSRTILSQRGQQNLLPYSADATVFYNISPVFSATTDYNLLFGNETAHRLRLSVSAYASKKMNSSAAFGVKRISIVPALTAIMGTEISAYNIYQPATQNGFATPVATTRLARIRQRILAKRNSALAAAEAGYNGFGLMALDLSVPIRVTFAGFRIGVTNHLVRPFKLYAREELSTDAIYYADVSVTWIIK